MVRALNGQKPRISGSRGRRGRAALAGLVAGAMMLAACGGGGGDDPRSARDDDDDRSDETVESTVDDDRGTSCPATGDVLAEVNNATWAVYAEVIIVTDQGPQLLALPIGTAWTVERRLLVTNAHVTEAFVEIAAEGVQIERAIAIQAGTGAVVTLLRELTHPGYTGDPLTSPDVGLFTTREEMTGALTLAPDDVGLELSQEIHIVGFPGDVTEFIEIIPGQTVPQATSLNGQITALRSHDDTQQVTAENVDVIQHQAPTTPGTSGSSMVSCGEVIGVNNAGTVQLIATPGSDGSIQIDRTAAAANNFAVHVRHIREMVELFDDNAIQGEELPVPATVIAVPESPPPMGGDEQEQPQAGDVFTLDGQVDEPYSHTFVIDIQDGIITGTSTWGSNTFTLSGQLFQDGSFFFIDDAEELSGGQFSRGFYEGEILDDVTLGGVYYEEGNEASTANFVAILR